MCDFIANRSSAARCPNPPVLRFSCGACGRRADLCAAHSSSSLADALCNCKHVPTREVLDGGKSSSGGSAASGSAAAASVARRGSAARLAQLDPSKLVLPASDVAEKPAVAKSRALLAERLAVPATDIVYVGVTFRTDSLGEVHVSNDTQAIRGMNDMLDRHGNRLFPFTVVPVSLPLNAAGAASPVREARWSDLDGIHLLYIPGGPSANDTQEGSSTNLKDKAKEAGFNKVVPPARQPKEPDVDLAKRVAKYERNLLEHTQRALYELDLIDIARARGVPVLAVCAGSWRLLESYGGKVRTLEITQRKLHKLESGNPWTLEHAVHIPGQGTMAKLLQARRVVANAGIVMGVNSTHWAVASTDQGIVTSGGAKLGGAAGAAIVPIASASASSGGSGGSASFEPMPVLAAADKPPTTRGELRRGRRPLGSLAVTAMAPNTKTVEAFEALYGAPTMGVQWHPEGYLPYMEGEKSGSAEARALSHALFELMAFSAQTSKRRHAVAEMLPLECQAFSLLKDAAAQMAQDKPVGAGNAYSGACSLLPVDKWSFRMRNISKAIDLLGDYHNEMKAGKHVGAAMVFRDARAILARYGIAI